MATQSKRPAGRSPFAGIARIRSLGVAVQPLAVRPLSRPVATPVTRRLVRSSSLDHLADHTHAVRRRGRAPRAESPGMHGPNVVSPAQAKAPIRPRTINYFFAGAGRVAARGAAVRGGGRAGPRPRRAGA